MEYHWHLLTVSIYLVALSSTKIAVTQKLVPGIDNSNKSLHKIDKQVTPNDFKNIEELIQSPSFQNVLRKEVNRTIDIKIKEIQKLLKKQGCDCPRGPPGPPGTVGVQGPQGPPGIRGSRGERGPIGLSLYAPELKEQNLHIDVNISEAINASCTFFGNPLPNITWQLTIRHVRFENEINRNNSEVKSIAILKNVSWIDRGLIKCIASSILGIVEANGALVVHRNPSIKALPLAIYSHIGVPFTFPRCEAIGYPDAQITWTRGFMKMDRSRTTVINQTIVFSSVNIEDEGFYVCAAKNYLGYDQKTIQFKTKPLSFARELKSFPLIRPDENITLSCAAFGYTQEMTGSWYHGRSHRKIPSTNHSEDGLFNVTTVVNKSGIYQCEIKMNSNAIKRRIFVREYSFGSSLLSQSQVKQLYKWIRKQKNDSEVHLHEFEQCWLMKGNNGGALYVYNYKPYEYQQKYQKQCNPEDEIILLMKDLKGNIFGGFNNRKGRNNNFLFDFKKGAMFEKNSIYGGICNYFGPCFYVDLQFEKYKTFYGGFLRYSSKLNNRFNGKGYKHLGDSPSGELSEFEILHKVSRD